jgi:hypothetical protein
MDHPWWPLILALADDLDQARIAYSLEAATAFLAQGIDVPGMDDIDIPVQPDFLDQAHTLFGAFHPATITRREGWAFFRFHRDGVPVDILAYDGTVMATDPDRVTVEYGGRPVYAKSLDFFYRHSPPGHWRRRLIDQFRARTAEEATA